MLVRLMLLALPLQPVDAETGQSVGVTVGRTEHGVLVTLDGKPFTEYRTDPKTKPYFWPVVGPGGHEVTRAWPMAEGRPGERTDHLHHRSMWFTFGKVNGVDFWSEHEGHGTQKTTSVELTGTGFVARTEWLDADGKPVIRDRRTFGFGADGDARFIDARFELFAGDEPLKFGDDKEGLFGVRVAGSMRVDQEKKGETPPGGTIVNSAGDRDAAAWGKRAKWCDYSGPVGEDRETVGIAIFDAPSNFRHPTYWHVRTYGLFAPNPFGLSFFTGDKGADGSHVVPAGQSLRFDYRVLIHPGDAAAAELDRRHAAWGASFKDAPPQP